MHILFLHPALGAPSLWAGFTSTASESENAHGMVLALPAHAYAPDLEGSYTIETLTRWLIGRIEESLKEEFLHIVGHSLGGYLAICAHLERPDLPVKQITTINTKFNWTKEGALAEASRLVPDVMQVKIPGYTELLAARHGMQAWKHTVNRCREMTIGLGERQPLVESTLAKVQIPVQILRGELDAMVTESESTKAAEAIPQSSFHSLPNTPHPLEKLDPQLLTPFLKG